MSWHNLLEEDILFNNNNKNFMPRANKIRFKDFVMQCLTSQSYFHHTSPMIYPTYYCTGILHLLGEGITKATRKYIKSLQVEKCGFAETTGETAWLDKTYMAVQMCIWHDIEIDYKTDLIDFIQSFQNQDGGFGSISHESSNLQATYQSVFILDLLLSRPKRVDSCIKWVEKHPNSRDLLSSAYFQIIKQVLTGNKSNGHINPKTWKEMYYIDRAGLTYTDTEIPSNIIDCTLEDKYYIAYLLKKSKNLHKYKTPLRQTIHNHEFHHGGYCTQNDISIISNGFMYHSTFLNDILTTSQQESFCKWLMSVKSHGGWGSRPKQTPYHEYTVTSLTSLKLTGKQTYCDDIDQLSTQELKNALSCPAKNNYYVLRTIKNYLERCILMDIKPIESARIVRTILSYYLGSGFGGRIPYLYATFWGIRALYLIEGYQQCLKRLHMNKLNRIRHECINWIKACQNNDGGFGMIPGVPSNIQSTYCAYYSLWMLGSETKNKEAGLSWLISLQQPDGGFAGSQDMSSEMLHSLYTISSLKILDSK
ncbi:hypothetical protein K9M79_04860 [Candidatus Woesearchaeota archaeon]|nr:hypothetical protein [Candidatus Woesearchaeota archaeon]